VTLLVAIAGLLLLVFIHELGHFVAAKAVGMRATRFYIGFPPAVAKLRRGDTEYGIGAIPLGGYVRITGMGRPLPRDVANVEAAVDEARRNRPPDRPDRLGPAFARARAALAGEGTRDLCESLAALREALEQDRDLIDPERYGWCERDLDRTEEDAAPRSYWRQPVWKRVVAIVAGPAANVLAAAVILVVYFASGVPHFSIVNTVDVVGSGSPAAKAGMRHGDVIERIDGVRVRTSDQAHKAIQRPGPVTVTVRRAGQQLVLRPVTPIRGGDGARYLGFEFTLRRDGTTHYGLGGALRNAWSDLSFTTTGTFSALGSVATGGSRSDLSTPVGIVQTSQTTIHEGVYPRLLALISLSLALFNLLPFLPLDGGHVLFALIELVRRKPVRRETYERVSAVGIAAMLALFAFGLSNDIGRIANGPTIHP
jgi:regulator of sigma E protease